RTGPRQARRSQHWPGDDLGGDLALEVPAPALASEEPAVLDHHLATQHCHHGPGEDVVALPGRIVGLVQVFRAYLAATGRVGNGEVGVAACRDGTFARVEPHDLGGIGRYQIDEAGERIAASRHHLGIHHAETWLDPRIAARGVVDAPTHRLFAQRAAQLIGGHAVDGAHAGAVPQSLLVFGRLERGIGVVDLAIWQFIVFGRVQHVLVQALAVDGQTVGTRLTYGGDAGRRGDVHHIECRSRHALGQSDDATEAQILRQGVVHLR